MLAELRRCGLTDSESCLKSLTLSLGGGHTVSAGQGGVSFLANDLCPSRGPTEAAACGHPHCVPPAPLVGLLSDGPQRDQLRGGLWGPSPVQSGPGTFSAEINF